MTWWVSRHRRRTGFVQTTILLFILPLLIITGLALLQMSLLRSAQLRVLEAAKQGAECGCRTGSIAEAHRCAGLTLDYLGGDYKTEFDYVDSDGNGSKDALAIGVTIPMNAVSTNYLGLFCGSHVDGVRLRQVVIRPCVCPSPVLFDVSSPNNLQQDDAWGINFKALNPGDMTNIKIVRVEFDLLPPGNLDTGNDASFDFFTPNAPTDCSSVTVPPVISNSIPTQKVAGQNDVFGLDASALTCSASGTVFRFFNSQVEFVYDTTMPAKLVLNFKDNGLDGGFQPGDRIRFGAKVKNLDNTAFANSNDDGDEVGRVGVRATVTYALNNVPILPPTSGIFFDSNFRGVCGNYPAGINPCVPSDLPFVLPLAPANGNGNDDQSYLLLNCK